VPAVVLLRFGSIPSGLGVGKTHSDYMQRVEPSVTGGEKMADAFLRALS
jgi:hypothetical protein